MHRNRLHATAAGSARAYLERVLSDTRFRHGDRLPVTANLARTAGVSVNAMSAAVRGLVQEGRLEARRRRGITVVKQPFGESEGGPFSMAVERGSLDRRLRSDILWGELHALDPLPSVKELARRYGVCYRTVRRSLDALSRRNLIERRGVRYAVRVPTIRVRSSVVCMVEPGFARDTPGFQYAAWHAAFVRGMEEGCRIRGVPLQVVGFPPKASLVGQALSVDRGLLGAAVWAPDSSEQYVRDLVAGLRPHTRHVVLFDPVGETAIPASTVGAFLSVLRVPMQQPGRDMATHLLGLGHTHVAYFSPYHGMQWSVRRQEGLASVLAESGVGVLSAYTFDSLSGVRAGQLRSGDPTSRADTNVLSVAASAGEVLARHAIELRDRLAMERAVYRNAELTLLSRLMEPLFRQALADKAITAWVCANDKTALLAIDYLREHRIDVPGTISVAGFDDALESLDAGLTTYSFGIHRAALQAVAMLLFPDMSARGRTRIEDIAGRVVHRASVVARPRARSQA